ncbi:MAG: efflux RND transporter periplasmic adaptor subunit [Desulfobacteraceae bacterium]
MNMQIRPSPDVAQTVKAGTSRRSRRRWTLFILGMIFLVALGPLGYRWARGNGGEDALPFITERVTRGSLVVTVSATGTLEPTNEVEVGSELSGIVETVEVDYNDRVKIGQVLARLGRDKLEAVVKKSQASLASARAQVLKARASVAEARSDLSRLEKVSMLSRTKAVSVSDLEAARATLARAEAEEAVARAAVVEAEASLQSNKTDLAKTLIYAPINGIVLTRSVEPGQTVAASLQAPVLFTLAEDLTQMELHVDVDEADVGRVHEGQEAVFTVDAFPDRTYEARIIQVRYGAETNDGVVTYETILSVDNQDLSLRPGMTATAEITVEKVENALLVPNTALRFSPPTPKGSGKGEKRGLMRSLLPGPPRRNSREGSPGEGLSGPRVWSQQSGGLVPVSLVTGVSDGTRTVVIHGRLAEGQEIVVDTAGGTS